MPGIATNLLADRLCDLEAAGILRREDPRAPVATPVFRLTDRGRGLLPAIEALAVCGGGFVPEVSGDAEFRTRWMLIPIEAMLTDHSPEQPPSTILIRTGEEPVTIQISEGSVRATVGIAADEPDLVITGPPKPILGIIAGKLQISAAPMVGVAVTGDRSVLQRAGLSIAG